MLIRFFKKFGIALFFMAVIMLNLFLIRTYVFPILLDFYEGPDQFSQEAWNEAPYHRGDMVDDLLAKYDFLSMTKDEVINLLGTQRLSVGNETLRYETGGGFLSDEILMFIFDDTGMIIDVGRAN